MSQSLMYIANLWVLSTSIGLSEACVTAVLALSASLFTNQSVFEITVGVFYLAFALFTLISPVVVKFFGLKLSIVLGIFSFTYV